MGHWYSKSGDPVYQVPYADPKKGLRDTTLRDAKKLDLVKSVTTVLDVPDKPALLRWKIEQVLKAAAASLHTAEQYNYEDWCRKVLHDSEEIGRESAKKGSIIHDALEMIFKSEDRQEYIRTKTDPALIPFVKPTVDYIESTFMNYEWVAEESFASAKYKYGGRIDLYSPHGVVIDFKTKATNDIKKMVAYDGHRMQLAAYVVGLDENNKFIKDKSISNIKRINIFISTEEPELINVVEHGGFERDFRMFSLLNEYWDLINNF